MTVQTVFGSVWEHVAYEHASPVIVRLSGLSRNPFQWHNVIKGLMHASTWPGTALAYRQLLGVIFLSEPPNNITCDSTCEFCGADSLFQTTVNAVHTALNYPRVASTTHPESSSRVSFFPKFMEFVLDVCLSRSSPYREGFGEIISKWKHESLSKTNQSCPISMAPSIVEIFSTQDNGRYFFASLRKTFRSTVSPDPPVRMRTALPSVSSFFIMMLAKMYEAGTVEGGRNFDNILSACTIKFAEPLPSELAKTSLSPVASPRFRFYGTQQCATSLVEIIRHSLVSMFLPPTEWTMATGPSIDQILKADKLERCTQFMEPSAVLSVIRYMLTQPGAIPNLSGNNEGKFNYVISKIKILNFDIDRSVCLVKSVKTSTPAGTPAPPVLTQSQGARLALIVKEVSVQVEHEWRIEWNAKRYGSYYGTNTVTIRGLSSQINMTLFPDDQGPVIDSATVSLGQVEHSCSILNSNFISEIVAQAALDWFAEPLTRLLQTASQSALDQFLKSAALDFRLKIWNASILKLVPVHVLAEIVAVLNDHLPRHGVAI